MKRQSLPVYSEATYVSVRVPTVHGLQLRPPSSQHRGRKLLTTTSIVVSCRSAGNTFHGEDGKNGFRRTIFLLVMKHLFLDGELFFWGQHYLQKKVPVFVVQVSPLRLT